MIRLREEALATSYTISGQGAVQIAPKKQLRSHLGRSPDRLDAVVMGLAVGAETVSIGGETGMSTLVSDATGADAVAYVGADSSALCSCIRGSRAHVCR
jgi:hypothetical protein